MMKGTDGPVRTTPATSALPVVLVDAEVVPAVVAPVVVVLPVVVPLLGATVVVVAATQPLEHVKAVHQLLSVWSKGQAAGSVGVDAQATFV